MKTPKSPKSKATPPAAQAMPSRMSGAEFQARVMGDLPQFATAKKPQIRLEKRKEDNGMNANEKRLLAQLGKMYPKCVITYEALTFRLPGGTVYTPDFVVTKDATIVAIYEAKDSYLNKSARDAKGKFKTARATYPQWEWVFAQWDKTTQKYLFAK